MTPIQVVLIGVFSGIAGAIIVELTKAAMTRVQSAPHVRVLDTLRPESLGGEDLEDTLDAPPPSRSLFVPVTAASETPPPSLAPAAAPDELLTPSAYKWLYLGLAILFFLASVLICFSAARRSSAQHFGWVMNRIVMGRPSAYLVLHEVL